MFGLMLHQANEGWIRTAYSSADEVELHERGAKDVRESQENYRKCVDAGIDVPFFDDYKVFPL